MSREEEFREVHEYSQGGSKTEESNVFDKVQSSREEMEVC